jgi:hypothetical protein
MSKIHLLHDYLHNIDTFPYICVIGSSFELQCHSRGAIGSNFHVLPQSSREVSVTKLEQVCIGSRLVATLNLVSGEYLENI